MSGTEAFRPPAGAGKVMGLVQFKGRVILAMEGGVFFLNEDGKLEPVEFVQAAAAPVAQCAHPEESIGYGYVSCRYYCKDCGVDFGPFKPGGRHNAE